MKLFVQIGAAVLAIGGLIVPSASYAITPASTAIQQKVSCAELNRQYDFVFRQIADVDADGMADDSAPRETNRQLKILNFKQDQLILLEFMRMNGCPAPSKVGASVLYLLPAMQCQTEMLKGNTKSEACDMSKWQPSDTGTGAQ